MDTGIGFGQKPMLNSQYTKITILWLFKIKIAIHFITTATLTLKSDVEQYLIIPW